MVFIEVNGIGASFFADTSYKYNLLSPCFVDFFSEEDSPSQGMIEFNEKDLSFIFSEKHTQTHLNPFVDVFKRNEGIVKIKCKDGIRKGCESVTLKFEHNEKSYSELFYIDQSLCSYCTPKNKVSGIIGINFLKNTNGLLILIN